MNKIKTKYDLEDRTAKFSIAVIYFAKNLTKDIINKPIIYQLVKSATSIGANYFEANGASSKRDFKNKIYICKKEARETKYWLDLIVKINPENKLKCRELREEAQELTLIFSKIILTIENRNKEKFKI